MTLTPPKHDRGTALLVVMSLLAVMTVLILVVSQSLFVLKRDLKLIEQRQIDHQAKTPVTK